MGKLGTLMLALVVGVGVGPGCSESARPRADAPFKDGTRLKAVHYVIDGAPPYFLGWYDSVLGVDCSFLYQGFGDPLVCFPSQPWQPTFATDTYLFADSACSQPVVGTYYPGETRYYVPAATDTGSTCGSTPARLFRVGDIVPPDAPLYIPDENGACRAAMPSNGSRYPEQRVLGPEITADTLVHGALRHDDGPGRVVPLTIAGSDGSLQGGISDASSIVAWDSGRQEMVFVSTSLTPDSRWFPTSAYDGVYFSNADCSVRAAVGTSCQPAGKEASVYGYDTCGLYKPVAFYDLGARLDDATTLYYAAVGINTCTLANQWPVTDPSYQAFAVGALIPTTSFAEAIEVNTGTGQLQVVQAAGPDGRPTAAFGLLDSVNGRPCTVSVAAADGTIRCLPDAYGVGDSMYYADEACSIPLVSYLPPGTTCAPAPTLVSVDEYATEPGGVTRRHIHEIGEPYAGMFYFKVSGSSCFAIGPSDGFGLVALGPEIPAASFAPVTVVRPTLVMVSM